MRGPGRGLSLLVTLLLWTLPSSAQIQSTATLSPFDDFARQLERSLQAGDEAVLRRALDVEGLLDEAMRGIDGSPEMRQGFRAGGGDSARSLATLVASALKKPGARYRLLRIRRGPGGRPQALYRLLTSEGAVNYHEYALVRSGSGPVRVSDLFIFFNGEWFSQTLRRGWLGMVGEQGLKGDLGRLLGAETELVQHVAQLKAIQALQAQGQHQQALAAWFKLPVDLRVNKNLLMQRVQIALKLGEKEYGEAVAAFSKLFPADPALDLLLIDFYLAREDYDACLAAIVRLGRAVGGDSHLDFLSGEVLYRKKDVEGALAALRAATANEPTLVGPYWSLTTIALDRHDYAETARLLTVLERELGVELGDLKGVEVYAGFVASNAYEPWMRSRGK